MADVTLKNTKQEIFDALTKAQQELTKKQSIAINVKEEDQKKKEKETIKKAEEAVKPKEEPELSAACKAVAKMVDNFFDTYEKSKEEFNSIQEAIEIKKKHLQELYNIESTLFDFSAVVNSKLAWEAEFEKSAQEKRERLQEELKRLEKEASEKKAENEKTEKEYKEEIEKLHKRQEEDYKYDVKRRHLQDEDSWNDVMKVKREKFDKECDVIKEDLSKRVEAIKEHEEKINEINAKIEELQKKLDDAEKDKTDAVEDAVQKAKKKAEESYGYKERYLKKEHEASESLLQSKLEMVTAENEANKNTISDLQAKLDKAYAEMKDMAANAVNGAAIQKAYTSLNTVGKETK